MIRVINSYGDNDGIDSSVQLFQRESDALKEFLKQVNDYLYPEYYSRRTEEDQGKAVAEAEAKREVQEFLDKVEHCNEHHLDEEDIYCKYNPQTMYFSYHNNDDNYHQYIEGYSLDIN